MLKLLKMKNSLICLFLFFLPLLAFSQTERQLLLGTVISDSLKVESISVINTSSKRSTITNEEGNFAIHAKISDTLQFSGLAFRDAQVVLRKADFMLAKFVVKLDVNVNVMDEIVITSNPLTGNLAVDSKRVKPLEIKLNFDPVKLTDPNSMDNYAFTVPIQNNALPNTGNTMNGINFNKVARLFSKPRKKSPPPPIDPDQGKTFHEIIAERYSDRFFTDDLKIPYDEIGLFIAFCDGGAETRGLLDSKHGLELTEYFIKKAAEYLNRDK